MMDYGTIAGMVLVSLAWVVIGRITAKPHQRQFAAGEILGVIRVAATLVVYVIVMGN
jgi:hypothetical protein